MLKNLRYLFSVLLLAVFSVNAWASVVTFNFTGTNEYGSGVAPSTASDYISISFAQGDVTIDATGARYWYNANGNTLRLYKNQNSTMTVSVPSGYIIKEISATVLNFGTVSTGSISGTTWTGSANSVTFSDCGANLQFKEIVVTYQEDGGDTPPVVTVNTPTFSVASGEEVLAGTEVTITADEGCVIEYSINGGTSVTSESNVVTVTVNEDMTITAVARDVTGAPSDEVSASYTVVTPMTIAEFKALTAGESAWLSLDGAQVLAVFANDIYIKDATGAIDIYNVALEVSEGDILSGVVKATYSIYKNQPEITAIVGDVTVTGNETVEPVVITPAEIADHMMELVKFENANVADGWILDDAGDVQVYDKTGEITIYDGTFNVTGIAILFNDKWEVCPRRGADIEVVETVVSSSISAAEVATLYNADKALEVPTGVVAYTAKIDEVTGEVIPSVTFNAGDVIPAGEAVILEGAEGNYDFQIVANPSTELDDANVLHGETENGFTSYGAATMSWWYYLLADGPKGIAFYWGADNGAAFPCQDGRAYIALPAGSNAKVLLFGGEATGIKTIDKANVENGAVYNLNGQRVNPTQRGIYIVNGKKVVLK